jgi:hypothetical protein
MLKIILLVVEIVEMSTADAEGGGEDGNGGGDPKGKNTNTTPDPKKMSTLERGMLRYM